MLKNREVNRRRGAEQTWVKQTQNRRQSGDIYAFGVVMYEILFRGLPFPEGTNYGGESYMTTGGEFLRFGSNFAPPPFKDPISKSNECFIEMSEKLSPNDI